MKAKKFLSMIVAICMIMSVMIIPAYAADYEISIDAEDSAFYGEDYVVTVKVKSPAKVTMVGCDLKYDATYLTFVKAEGVILDDSDPDEILSSADFLKNPENTVDGANSSVLLVTTNDNYKYNEGGNAVEWLKVTFKVAAGTEMASTSLALAENALWGWGDKDGNPVSGVDYGTAKAVSLKPARTQNPTATVTIDNMDPAAGDTLTASYVISGDEWGITESADAVITWKAGTEVLGTGETYTVDVDDWNKAITATVAGTVDAPNFNELDSVDATTDAVTVADVAPTLDVVEERDDTVAVGTAIAANATATTPALVGGTNTITYTWKVDGNTVYTGSGDAYATYTIVPEDYVDGDEMLTCVVTASNNRTTQTATKTITFIYAIVAGNMPPVVSNMALSNVANDKAVVGATVEASYTFTDVADAANTPEDLDGGVIVEWYIGEEKIAEGTSLVIDKKWIGETVDVYFAPWSNDGTENEVLGYVENDERLLAGEVKSLSFTVEPDLNTAPVVSEVVVLGGAIYLEKEFTVNYKYVDINGFAPNCTIALYKAADDSAVDGAAYTVNGNKVTVTDASLVDTALYVKVTPGNPEGYTYVAQLVGADSADLTLGDKPKASTGGGGITGPMLGGGGSSAPTTTPAPSTEPTTEPTTTPEPTTPVEAPVPAAKDCISLVIDDKTINAYGEAYEADVAPYIVEDRTVLPVRAICELLGAKVEWIEATRSVVLRFEGRIVELSIGSKIAKIDGQEVELNIAPFITSDRTFLGLRDMAEAINMNVEWHNSVRTVSITAK